MFRSALSYVRSSVAELRHVDWPSRREVIQYTVIIIASVAIAMLIVAALDSGLSVIVDQFLLK